MKKYSEYLLVFSLFVLITLILTYPLITVMTKFLPGFGDNFTYYWWFWIFKQSITSFKNPFFTDYIFYPIGVHLPIDPVAVEGIIFTLLSYFSPIFAYNFIYLETFVLSAFGMYLLSKYFTNDTLASFFSGIAFAFTSQRLTDSLGFLNLLAIHWVPFFIYFLFKFVEKKKVRDAILSGIFLGLASLDSLYHLVLSLTFLTILMFYLSWTELKKPEYKKRILIIFGIGYLIFSFVLKDFIFYFLVGFFFYFIFELKRSNSSYLKREFLMPLIFLLTVFFLIISPLIQSAFLAEKESSFESDLKNTILATYLIPHIDNPIFKNFVAKFWSQIGRTVAESTHYIGIVVFILLVYSFFIKKEKYLKFWLFSAFFFFFLSLGPYLILYSDRELIRFNNQKIPLPFYPLEEIPILNKLNRLDVVTNMFFLSTSVLSAYSISYILKRKLFEKKAVKLIFIIILVTIFLYDSFYNLPFVFTSVKHPQLFVLRSVEVPQFYYDIPESGNYTILELPLSEFPNKQVRQNFTYIFHQYYQTIHGKKILGGYTSRTVPQNVINFTNNTFFIKDIKLNNYKKTNFTELYTKKNEINKVLYDLNIKYIILHKQYNFKHVNGRLDTINISQFYSDYFIKIKELLDKLFIKVYEDSQIIVYI